MDQPSPIRFARKRITKNQRDDISALLREINNAGYYVNLHARHIAAAVDALAGKPDYPTKALGLLIDATVLLHKAIDAYEQKPILNDYASEEKSDARQ